MNKLLTSSLSKLFPKLVVSFAYKKLTNPQVRKLRSNEEKTLEKSETNNFKFGAFDIKLYKWGNGSKKILLIHGWEGQAGNFSDLIEKTAPRGLHHLFF